MSIFMDVILVVVEKEKNSYNFFQKFQVLILQHQMIFRAHHPLVVIGILETTVGRIETILLSEELWALRIPSDLSYNEQAALWFR